jgi:6-phosphogluconolactonase
MASSIVFVGTYASAAETGIPVLRFDGNSGELKEINGAKGIEKPSFVTFDAKRQLLFAVSETKDGAVVSYSYDAGSGALSELNRQLTRGDHPCHLNLDKSGAWLLAVNYSSGSVCVYPVAADGRLGPMADFVQHSGHSVRADRQEAPHPHSIWSIPGTDDWLVPDLGLDRLIVYRLDPASGKLSKQGEVPTAEGAGPRHAAFHPQKPIVYIITELSNTIEAYAYEPNSPVFTRLQDISTLPADFGATSYCADIHVSSDGAYVYGSNRGHDSIAVFRVRQDGTLEAAGYTATDGQNPRNFALDPSGRWLLAANQNSNAITVLRRREDGTLEAASSSLTFTKPVCLKFG